MPEPAWVRWATRLTLPNLRGSVRSGPLRRLWALTAVAFAGISMFLGNMVLLFLQPSAYDHQPIHVYAFTSAGQISNPYLRPAVLVTAPHAVLAFAFWPTLVMGLISAGIGLAIASSVGLLALERRRRADLAASGAAPVVAGGALLGACCCTTCAAQAAAVGVLGAAAGSSAPVLIATAWPIGLLQLVILGASLLYMERELEGASALLGVPRPAPSRRRTLALVLRFVLLIAAITWLFAFLVEWSATTGPVDAALAYHWLFEHWVLGLLALVSGLGPLGVWAWFERHARSGYLLRGLFLVAGITWGIGVPPALAAWGLGGTVNEILGYLGVPLRSGGIPADAALGLPLLFHWAFQHIALSAWALAVAVRPSAALSLLTPDAVPRPSPAAASLGPHPTAATDVPPAD
jgi:hypothetical protein